MLCPDRYPPKYPSGEHTDELGDVVAPQITVLFAPEHRRVALFKREEGYLIDIQ
jgi:hypothetical protein